MKTVDKVTATNHVPTTIDTSYVVRAGHFNDAVDAIVELQESVTANNGTDATPAIRSNNPIVGTNPPNTNIDLLDAAIGTDAQIATNPINIVKANSINQNLNALDTYKTVRTIKKTIGGVGVAGCDFNFAAGANTTEQVIDLGAIIPAKARIIDVMTFTDAVFTGATTLVAETGTSSSGNELIASASIYAANAITATPATPPAAVIPTNAARNIFVAATPGANWDNVTAGKVSVYITFRDVTNI